MRTPEMSDDELDELFRRSAAAYSSTDDEVPLGAWLRMEEKLTQAHVQEQVRQQTRRQVGRLFGLEMLLIGMLLLWRTLSVPDAAPQPAAAPTAAATAAADTRQRAAGAARAAAARPAVPPAAPTPATAPSGSTIETAAASTAEAAGPAARPADPLAPAAPPRRGPRRAISLVGVVTPPKLPLNPERRATLAATENRSAGAAAAPNQQALATPVAALATGEKARPVATEGVPAAATPETRATSSSPASSAGNAEAGQLPTTSPAAPASEATPAALVPTGQPAAAAPTDSAALKPTNPTTTPAAPDSARAPEPKPRERPAHRLVLGVAGAPELAAVRPSQLTRPGSVMGFTLEYRFTPRWRLRTGLLRSTKLYEARGSDYHPPANYWTTRVPIDHIDADCRMWEIPLEVRFDVLHRTNYAVFGNAGLSTLLMRNEQYTYGYDWNGEYVERTWGLARGSNHPFSVLNLSVGVERSLSERWAVQAEPFAKLPLGGVGFGRVWLRSAGVSVGIKYGL